MRQIFNQGIVVNLLNPKTAVFFLAFVPQFIDPTQGSTTQILILGGLFVLLGTLSDSAYALVAGSLGNALQQQRWWRRGRHLASGSVLITLGVVAAVSGVDTD
jgi:threonine/homoserine/homoserine lactone efflux protein